MNTISIDVPPTHWNNQTVRELERASIRAFMEKHRGYLKGRVLDFGCGKQPYWDLVDGEYFGYEPGDLWPGKGFDTIMCNQVVQYLPSPGIDMSTFVQELNPGGHLVMTYPTNWDEVEPIDLHRFTKCGMERLLKMSGFEILHHERRAEIALGGFKFPLGYGVVAKRL